jgi:hypothetical protein
MTRFVARQSSGTLQSNSNVEHDEFNSVWHTNVGTHWQTPHPSSHAKIPNSDLEVLEFRTVPQGLVLIEEGRGPLIGYSGMVYAV